jgi:(R,R)-butanediol dehydrogenase/meso-butanediol dehydrogenase/diacetyl reductase
VRRSCVEPGQSALIAGAAPIGIGIRFALRACGVEKVLISEPSADRWAVAELGAKPLGDPSNDDLAAEVADFTSAGPGGTHRAC